MWHFGTSFCGWKLGFGRCHKTVSQNWHSKWSDIYSEFFFFFFLSWLHVPLYCLFGPFSPTHANVWSLSIITGLLPYFLKLWQMIHFGALIMKNMLLFFCIYLYFFIWGSKLPKLLINVVSTHLNFKILSFHCLFKL